MSKWNALKAKYSAARNALKNMDPKTRSSAKGDGSTAFPEQQGDAGVSILRGRDIQHMIAQGNFTELQKSEEVLQENIETQSPEHGSICCVSPYNHNCSQAITWQKNYFNL